MARTKQGRSANNPDIKWINPNPKQWYRNGRRIKIGHRVVAPQGLDAVRLGTVVKIDEAGVYVEHDEPESTEVNIWFHYRANKLKQTGKPNPHKPVIGWYSPVMDSTWGRGWFSGWSLEPTNQHRGIKKEIKEEPTRMAKRRKATRKIKKEDQKRIKHKTTTHNAVKREGVKLEPKRETKTKPTQDNLKREDQETRGANKIKKEET